MCVACCAEVLRAVLVLVSVFFFSLFFSASGKVLSTSDILALRSRLSLPLGHYHDGGSSSSFSNSSTKIAPLPSPLEGPSSAG